jgi:enoyl-CoA hydratase
MNDAASFETITVLRGHGVAEIMLNRPARLNAISRTLMAELHTALDQIETDEDIGAVVLHGAGRAFCSGFDLKDDAAEDISGEARWRELLEQDLSMHLRFWDFPKPTIAAVHGYCLAGGLELAMSCDVTIASAGTFLGEPELKFGTVITNLIMPWLVGPKITKELLLSGEDRITAERAERIGLVNQVVAEGEHLDVARTMARRMAALDPDSVRMTKQAINATFEIMGLRKALAAGLDTAVALEVLDTPSRQTFRELTRTEGLKAAIAWRDQRLQQED